MADAILAAPADFVNVVISNSKDGNACPIERRFQKDITVLALKGKLELLTGGNASTMHIELYNKEDTLVAKLDDDNASVACYPIQDGMRLHVIDKFLLRGEFEDTSKVEKFELSLDDYAKRGDTVKAFLERNRLGKYNEEEQKKRDEERQREEAKEEAAAKAAKIGDRCEVRVPGQPVRRATVMYTGQVEFKNGWWIGVKYDEPLGKNDGLVSGKRYFECQPKYGGFIKPTNVVIGDFPEEEYDLEEEL